MKEIIYLDTDIMNSILAQLKEGLITGFSQEESSQSSETAGQQSIRGNKAGFTSNLRIGTGMLPGAELRIGGNYGGEGTEGENSSTTFLEGQKDILNKAFHDYALELLTHELKQNELLVENYEDLKEGSLYLGESSYRFYDFNLLKKSMDYNFMSEMMLHDVSHLDLSYEDSKKLIAKKNPTAADREKLEMAQQIIRVNEQAQPIINILKQLNTFSTFASNLLEDLTVIKMGKNIGLLRNKNLRESIEALSFRTDKSRKVKYIMRVIGKKDVVFNGKNFSLIREQDLDIIPNMMLDILLGSFKIIEQGDLLVTPIAIYFE